MLVGPYCLKRFFLKGRLRVLVLVFLAFGCIGGKQWVHVGSIQWKIVAGVELF